MWQAARLAEALRSGTDPLVLVEDLAQAWFSPLRPTDGIPSAEIARASAPVPAALRSFYKLAGRREDLATANDPMLMPHELEARAGIVPFWYENQAVVAWAYALADGDDEDPPVYVTDHRTGWSDMADARWIRETDRMSQFLLEMTAFRAIGQGSRGIGGGSAFVDDAEELEAVVERWVQIGDDWHWPSDPTRFFGGRDIIVQAVWPEGGGQGELHVQARSESAWETFDQLPINWWQSWPAGRRPRSAESP